VQPKKVYNILLTIYGSLTISYLIVFKNTKTGVRCSTGIPLSLRSPVNNLFTGLLFFVASVEIIKTVKVFVAHQRLYFS